jgi:hypothetical protein
MNEATTTLVMLLAPVLGMVLGIFLGRRWSGPMSAGEPQPERDTEPPHEAAPAPKKLRTMWDGFTAARRSPSQCVLPEQCTAVNESSNDRCQLVRGHEGCHRCRTDSGHGEVIWN